MKIYICIFTDMIILFCFLQHVCTINVQTRSINQVAYIYMFNKQVISAFKAKKYKCEAKKYTYPIF